MILELQRATHATLQALTGRLEGLDLVTPAELNALGNLAGGTVRTASELGAAIGSRPTTVTGIIDRLELRGLITRGPHPGDRRAVLITLTGDGIAAAAAVTRVLAELEAEALAGLPPEAVAGALAVLRALGEAGR